MRLTAGQWLEQLARSLGLQAPAGNPLAYTAPGGEYSPQLTSWQEWTFKLGESGIMGSSEDKFVQVIPTGYYDTAWIAWTGNNFDGAQAPRVRPLLVVPGRFRPETGMYPLSDLEDEYLSLIDFLAQNPPMRVGLPAVDTGIAQVSSGELVIELQLTNLPFLVLFTDSQKFISEVPERQFVARVTLQTLRH